MVIMLAIAGTIGIADILKLWVKAALDNFSVSVCLTSTNILSRIKNSVKLRVLGKCLM